MGNKGRKIFLVNPRVSKRANVKAHNDKASAICKSVVPAGSNTNNIPALNAKLLQDGINHVNDVDIDLNHLGIHITPTSLYDCSQALSRILKLVETVTREMERRVHETCRSARVQGCNSKWYTLVSL